MIVGPAETRILTFVTPYTLTSPAQKVGSPPDFGSLTMTGILADLLLFSCLTAFYTNATG
jgi:hypothetical protein